MKNLFNLLETAPLKSMSILILSISISFLPGYSQDGEENPLAPFEWIIGGAWHFENAYQVFEWGVGKRSVKSKNYYIIEGDTTLVSEGSWFWHPGENQVRGYFTAIKMPVAFFDYSTRFEKNKIVSILKSYSPAGEESTYTEILESTSENTCEWSLLQETDEGSKKIMGSEFVRQSSK